MDIKTLERCLNASKKGIATMFFKEKGFQIKNGICFINHCRLSLHDDGFSVKVKSGRRNHFYHELPNVVSSIIAGCYDDDYSIK